MNIEQKMFKGLKIVSNTLTVVFCWLSYGDPVAWAATLAMAVASLTLLLVPEF
jgi:hypothetical protein